jgi:hypothetical protein
MSPKKKLRVSQKGYSKHSARASATADARRCEEQPREQRLEKCCGWLACVLIIAAPLVFNAGISNFADLPQRTVIQAAVARWGWRARRSWAALPFRVMCARAHW